MYPIVWLLANSLKHNLHYLEDLPKGFGLPRAGYWEFENYLQAFKGLRQGNTYLVGMIFNSLWQTILSLVLNMFVCSCTGYCLCKYTFRGRNLIYTIAIVCMILPIFGTGGASYTFYYVTGMYDTPLYVIWTSLGGFSTRFLMLYSFFKGISWDYAEAVFIDGGNDYTVFFKIMLPLAAPMILTLGVTGFIASWNSYESVLIYLPSYPTLAVGIFKVKEQFEADLPVYYSAMILSIIPVIALFIVFADKIMTNLSIGGLKG